MKGLFSLDSPLMQFLTRACDLIITNILFLFSCIPVFTIGAAICGMTKVCQGIVMDDDKGIWHMYVTGFKDNFKHATIVWLCILVVAVSLVCYWLLITSFVRGFWATVLLIVMAILAIIAASLAVYLFPLIARYKNNLRDHVRNAGILAITCAGSSFGAILKCMPIADSVGALVNSGLGVLIPFIIAMILKLAMGASTVAMITTAGMMAPMMEVMGFTSPLAKVIVVLAIGAGSMVASHAHDSYFWVVSQFSDMKTDEAYKCQTGMTAVMGITIIILLFVVSLFI